MTLAQQILALRIQHANDDVAGGYALARQDAADLVNAIAAAPAAWMRPLTGECTSASSKAHMESLNFGQWKEIAAYYTRPLFFHPPEDALDAARWRAFINSPYIKFQGNAGLHGGTDPNGQPFNNYAHFGMEIWSKYNFNGLPDEMVERTARVTAENRALLIKYADIAIKAQRQSEGD